MAMKVDPRHPALRVRKFYRRAAAAFDGNLSADPTNWLFPTEDFDSLPTEAVETLMARTVEGNVAWVIFPPAGFRL